MDRTCYNVLCTNIKQKDPYDDLHSTGEYLYFFVEYQDNFSQSKKKMNMTKILRVPLSLDLIEYYDICNSLEI